MAKKTGKKQRTVRRNDPRPCPSEPKAQAREEEAE